MYRPIRNSLILLAALATMSCNKDYVLDSAQDLTKAIKFEEARTKAEVTASTQILNFGVYAEQNCGEDGTAAAVEWVSLLSNEFVSRTDGTAEFEYDNTRYWLDNRTFRFFAYYPYIQDGATPISGVTAVVPVANSSNFPDFNISYVTPDTFDGDLLVANEIVVIDSDPNTDYPTVRFDFQHALSKVKFQIAKPSKNAANMIKVTSVRISAFAKSGIYNTYSNEWSEQSGELSVENSDITLDKDDIKYHEIGAGLFVPQSITQQSVSVDLEYEFYIQGVDENGNEVWTLDDTYTTKAYLPAIKWEPSKSYTYNMTISAIDNTIQFKSPTVETWGTPFPAGSLIIQ